MQKKILWKIIYRYNMKEGPPSNLGEGPDYLLRSMLNKMLKVTKGSILFSIDSCAVEGDLGVYLI